MAVIEDKQTVSSNVSGFKKMIDESAATMMLDNLQTFMYQRPIQSCARESVSNGIDAVKEKRMAIDILSGRAKVEDYYVDREIEEGQASLYQDSKFNKDYYDLKWLDTRDKVTITYHNTAGSKRDIFTIKDTGVGLGGRRLEGYFNLGYSSKRLNTKELGGFGLGAKSPLSTGVESYRVLSHYNGKEFCFDVYSHKVDCVYGKWNDDGTENEYYEFAPHLVGYEDVMDEKGDIFQKPVYNVFKAYYKQTKEKNGTSVIVEVKKHNKYQYFDAVKSQLMYVREDVTFTETHEENPTWKQDIPFKAKIMYEDDHIILSDSGYYRQPHFVIKNICYGAVNYNEMEMTPRMGNVAIKLQMENVDVVPSREALAYTPKTRQATVDEHEWVNKIVEEKIQTALNQDSFLEWTRACNRIMTSGTSTDDIAGRLSNLADKTKLKPTFKKTGIRYTGDMLSFITPLLAVQHVRQESSWNRATSKTIYSTKRDDSTQMSVFEYPCYFQFTGSSNRTTQYLMSIAKNKAFAAIRCSKSYSYLEPAILKLIQGGTAEAAKTEMFELIKEHEPDGLKAVSAQSLAEKAIKWLAAMASKGDVKPYSDTLVPESYVMKQEDQQVDTEAISEAQRKDDYKAILAKRKANKAFVGNIPGYAYQNSKSRNLINKFTQREVKYSELDIDTCKVVYGPEEQNPVFQLLTEMKRKKEKPTDMWTAKEYFWNKDLKLLRVAKSNFKYVEEDGIKLEDWVFNIDSEGVLTTCDVLKDALTASMIKEVMSEKAKFLANFGDFSPELSSSYRKMLNLVEAELPKESFTTYGQHDLITMLLAACRANIRILELKDPTPEDKLNVIPQTLKDKGVKDIKVVDSTHYGTVTRISKFADCYGAMLGYIEPLANKKRPPLPTDVVEEIKDYLRSKQDQLEGEYPDLLV